MPTPGARMLHQWPNSMAPLLCASASILPQLIAVGLPRPRKLRPASATMMPALVSAVLMISRLETAGRMCRHMMYQRLAPAISAALT